jgi:hypothetical protein
VNWWIGGLVDWWIGGLVDWWIGGLVSLVHFPPAQFQFMDSPIHQIHELANSPIRQSARLPLAAAEWYKLMFVPRVNLVA